LLYTVKDKVPSEELKERLGIDDIILVLQQTKQAVMVWACVAKRKQ